MPAPAGYKTFSAGAVLTAETDVQKHLMDQAVCVFADASARSTAISSPAEGQVSYLKDTNKIYAYTGGSWDEVGGIAWSGSTANGLATFGSASTVVAESTATYDGTTLQLTTSGGGLKLDGLNSSNANTLDDYEEGTFGWALTASGSGSFTLASGNDTGAYIRIGRMVFIQGTIELASVSSPVGTLRVGGFPFTIASDLTDNADRGAVHVSVLAMATAPTGGIYTHAAVGNTFVDVNAGDGYTANDGTLANDIDAGSQFVVSGSYYCAP
jgi:hypothetical protein